MINLGYSYRHVLGPEASGHTALSYLASAFKHSSAAVWRGRLEAGEVLVNGDHADWRRPLRPGQVLIWNRPAWQEEDTPQKYDVIYRDASLLVVDKPAGLPTLPGGGFYRNTLLSFVKADFPTARPMHRLGRGTSGLVVFALDGQAAARLQRTWPHVEKQYQALASAVAREDSYDIRVRIGHQPHERLGQVWAANPAGKAARSVARVLERRLDSTVFEVDLLTGRPHQIRIHLACIGHPLVGDPLYAIGGHPKPGRPGLPGDPGYRLHAKRLRFEHPISKARVELSAALPEEPLEKNRGG